MERSFATHSRIVNDLFAQYSNTFVAFCELINNALQEGAKNIYIEIEQAKDEELTPLLVRKIVIKDDGNGVPESEFADRILYIGTDAKPGGKGIGRFAAIQIGSTVEIETVAYDSSINKYTKVILPITEEFFKKNKDVSKITINTVDEVLEGKGNPYYQVTIKNLYSSIITEREKKKKLDENLLLQNIMNAIFVRYPIKILNKEIRFYVNNSYLNPTDFVLGTPLKVKVDYIDKKENEYPIFLSYFNIKSTLQDIKVFLTVKNAGIETIAATFEFNAQWLSPKVGSWFVYISSEMFTADMLRNFDFGDLDENGRHLRAFIKDQLNTFYKEKNKEFDDFKSKLRNDKYYPYKSIEATSNSKVIVFDKLAYLVEGK